VNRHGRRANVTEQPASRHTRREEEKKKKKQREDDSSENYGCDRVW
jgi:hypothetical protein